MLQQHLRPVGMALAAAGLIAACCYAFDIWHPKHFVGDMHGLEVMARSLLLLSALLPLCAGLLLALLGWKKDHPKLAAAGLMLADCCAALLIALALGACHSRRMDAIRATYPQKSTDELLRIAAADKDQFAVYEILARKDAGAVPALSRMLLDKDELPRIRTECAHALGQLGGDKARAALEQAAAMPGGGQYLTETISYSLEDIRRRQGKP